MHDVRLTVRERQVYESTDVRKPGTDAASVSALGISLDAWRVHRANVRRKLGLIVTERAPGGRRSLEKWERDPLEDETPREARARVALDLAEGRRCHGRLFSGGPCSLLLPCASHPRG